MSEKNYWLIPMDYRFCDYKQLCEEWTEFKRIMWQAPGKPRSLEKKEKNHKGITLRKDDIVYFYVTNLPAENKTGLSRIMLRGVIDEEPKAMEYRDVYMKSSDTSLIYGFPIVSLTTLRKECLEDNRYLSYDYELSKMEGFIYPQGMTRWPNKAKGNLSDELILKLENDSFKDSIRKKIDFKTLINHFNNMNCFFRGKLPGNHETFMGRNGIYYYEYHHFIPQAQVKRCKQIERYVYDPSNGLCLCSNCHNRIHYGTTGDINQMIEIALKDENIKKLLDEGFKNAISLRKEDDIINWFREVYKVQGM